MDGVSILFDPLVLKRLIFEGLWMSVQISAISIAISLVLGTFLGVAMSSKNKFIFFVLKICLEIVRIMPQIVWLFLFYYGPHRRARPAKSRTANDRDGEPNGKSDRAVLDIRLYIFIIFSHLLSYLKNIQDT